MYINWLILLVSAILLISSPSGVRATTERATNTAGADDHSPATVLLNATIIKSLNWDTTLKLTMADSTILRGKYEGFAGIDSGISDIDAILPSRNEIIEIYDINGVHQKFYFKGFYYQTAWQIVTPVFRLGTTADDVIKRLDECQTVIRANGDTLGLEPILDTIDQNEFAGITLELRNPDTLISINPSNVKYLSIIKTHDSLKKGILIGIVIYIALGLLLKFELQGANFE